MKFQLRNSFFEASISTIYSKAIMIASCSGVERPRSGKPRLPQIGMLRGLPYVVQTEASLI